MQISASLLALLAIPAARAIPINSNAGNNLSVRGTSSPGQASEISLLARNLSPKARGLAESKKSIYARYAQIKDDGERSVAVVRDLQRRGIIDTLVQALAAILTELLGTDGAPARHYRRQLTVLGMQTGSIVDDITCLILKLVGINDSNCAGKPTKRDVSAASNSFTGLNAADPVAMRESLGDMLSQVGRALEKEEFEGDTSLFSRDAGATTELLERQFPATLGVEGLLSVLRELLDAVLNTLLPLSPRNAVASPTTSAPRATGTNCPPPGTPNDGMYRPGCPGYGRRELSARDSEQLENMAPMLEMLIQKLEPLVQKADDAAATESSSSSSTDPASTSSSPATGDAASTTDGSESSAVDGALAQLSSSASTPGPSSSAPGGAAAASGAAPTVAARDFLGADGFQYVKRQATAADDSNSDSVSVSSTSSSASPSSTTETSASYSMVKGVVSELVGMFTGDTGSSSSKTSSASTDSGASSADSGSSSSFMNLMTNVLGGLSSRSVSEHPVLARHHVEHLLDRAVGTSPGQKMLRRLASPYIERALDMTNSVINARADFEPVWKEAKKLGNAHFGQRSNDMAQRSANDGSLQNVWSSFSKMVDDSFANDEQNASKRSPSPAVDVKPFEDAVVQWARKHFAGDGAKAKRDLQQFQPLAQAAGTFAKQQMKEWTVALNEHNGSQKA